MRPFTVGLMLRLGLTLALGACATGMEDRAQAGHEPVPSATLSTQGPNRISFGWSSWGRPTSQWVISSDGQVTHTDRAGQTVRAAADPATFVRLRELFKPYENRAFSCRVTVTDGPYGSLVWSEDDRADRSISYNAGCLSGDADDLFERLGQAETTLQAVIARP